jgi:glycine cleavage system H lipoate-binding protein
MDDFAGKLIGKADRITLPQRGQWIRQGQRMLTIERNGMTFEMVSPIEGSVSNVNEALAEDPNLARSDPYGEGWLLAVQAPDARTSFRNLLGGNLARKWMEEAAARLRSRMPQMAGALAQDGGLAVDDLSTQLPERDLQEMTHEFFLC